MQHNYWKLFRTSTFRLSALYLAVFILSVGAILAYIYWNTAGLLERQTDETIRAEVQGLADQYRIRGRSRPSSRPSIWKWISSPGR